MAKSGMVDPINPTKFTLEKKKKKELGSTSLKSRGYQETRSGSAHRRGVIQARALDVVIKTLGSPV